MIDHDRSTQEGQLAVARANAIHLPIVFVNSPRRGFRKFHLFISTPLVIYATIAFFWGDVLALSEGNEEVFSLFLLAVGISAVCEFFGYWANKAFAHRYEIDAKGVSYRDFRNTWFEPLSSYASVDWCEEVLTGTLNQHSFVHWRTYLRHATDPTRTVKLFSSGLFTGDKDRDRVAWRAMAQALELPARQIGGTGVTISEVSAVSGAAPVGAGTPEPVAPKRDMPGLSPSPSLANDRISAGDTVHSKIRVGRSSWAWVLPIFFTWMGAGILYQEVMREGLDRVLGDTGEILFMAVAALTVFWGWALTSYRIQVLPEVVTVVSCLGSYGYRSQIVDRHSLREILVHSNPFGVASVSLQSEGQRSVILTTLSYKAARQIQRFIVDAKRFGTATSGEKGPAFP